MSQDRTVGSRAPVLRARVSRCHNDTHTARRVARAPGRTEERGERGAVGETCELHSKGPTEIPTEGPRGRTHRQGKPRCVENYV